MAEQLKAVEQVLSIHAELTQSLGSMGLMNTQQARRSGANGNSPRMDSRQISASPRMESRSTLGELASRQSDVRKAFDDFKTGQGRKVESPPGKALLGNALLGKALAGDQSSLAMPLLSNDAVAMQAQTSQTSSSCAEDDCVLGSEANTKGMKKLLKSRSFSEEADNKRNAMFPDREHMKKKVLEHLSKPQYKVEDLYKTEGMWQALAKNERFQNAVLTVIVFNILWLAIDTDYNKAEVLCEAPLIFQVVNNFFCFAFVTEIIVRFMAFRNKTDTLTEPWFVFDGLLVALMVWETWVEVLMYKLSGGAGGMSSATNILRIFRMFRLTRVARLARVLRNLPELMILVKGMVVAIRSVVATLALLMIIIYVFALLLTQQLSGTEDAIGSFETVPQAMNTLLLNGIFTEEREFISKMLGISGVYYTISIIYLLLASLTVGNMLIGVLCEVVSVTASVEKEEMMLTDLSHKITTLIGADVQSGTHRVSRERFVSLLDNQEAVDNLHDAGIDIVALVDFADFIFKGDDELELAAFMEKVVQFRGTNHATVKDIVDTRMFLSSEISALNSRLGHKSVKPSDR
jgi:hypothetical protein